MGEQAQEHSRLLPTMPSDKENEPPSPTSAACADRPSLLSLWRRRFGRVEHPAGSSPHISSEAAAALTPRPDVSGVETMRRSESLRREHDDGDVAASTCGRPRLQHVPHPGLASTTTSPSIRMCGRTPCNTPVICDSADADGQLAAGATPDRKMLLATARKQHQTTPTIAARELAPALERQLVVSIEEQWASPRRGEALHRGGGLRKHVLQLRTMAKLASRDGATSDSVVGGGK